MGPSSYMWSVVDHNVITRRMTVCYILNRCWHRVHTHNRVESSPIQSSQSHKDVAVTLWLTYNVRHCSAYRPAESSLVIQVSLSQQSCYRMFHFCQSDSRDRGWWLHYWGRNGCEKAYSFSEGPWGNSLHLALWTLELRLSLIMMFITKTTAPLTTVIMILLLSGRLFKVFICYFWRSKEWQPTVNWFQITDSV